MALVMNIILIIDEKRWIQADVQIKLRILILIHSKATQLID